MKTDQAVKKILAPELQTVGWLNTPQPITLASLRGKVVLMHAFQMYALVVFRWVFLRRNVYTTNSVLIRLL